MSTKRTAGLVIALVLSSAMARAADLAGVTLPESVVLGGKQLVLNGIGIRKVVFVKVYVGGLYLEQRSKDGAAILSSEQLRRLDLVMLRDVDHERMSKALKEAINKNVRNPAPDFGARVERFGEAIPDLKNGHHLVLTYIPGKGTIIGGTIPREVTIEGRDFAEALFALWVGPKPVDDGLKKGLLGL